jgi:hypothetical protein
MNPYTGHLVAIPTEKQQEMLAGYECVLNCEARRQKSG